MFKNQGRLARRVTLAGFLALGLAAAASAQTATPATGLGQSWPNAADYSASPQWHVYVFFLHGIKYVQVNDLNGTVHAAIGTANGSTIILPIGVDAANVNAQPAATPSSASSTTVYQDASTVVTATPQSNGTTKFTALAISNCPSGYTCTGGSGG